MKILENKFINRFINDEEFKNKVTFYAYIIVTILFAIFNASLGIIDRSIWYGSIAVYFIALAIQRIYVFFHSKIIENKYSINNPKREYESYKMYNANGIIFLFIVIALSFSIIQMVTSKKPIKFGQIIAIVNAIYAFSKISIAISNVIKARKKNDVILRTIMSINLVDALVSMLTLTATMLTTFEKEGENNKPLIIAVSTGVSIAIFAISIYIILNSLIYFKKHNDL